MHEIGLAQAILDVALDAAADAPIRLVRVRIGDLHAVEDDSFAFAFALLAEGTPAAGAALSIDHVGVRTACRACGAERIGPSVIGFCPACGSPDAVATAGDELAVLAIELANGEWRFAPGVTGPDDAAVGEPAAMEAG
jgi:hydrogenase nickel incorporation protein HypA/HybF